MKNTELKPCPFCGGTKVKFDCEVRNRTGEYVFKYEIRCLSCPAIFDENIWFLDPCEAKQAIIDKWNTRADESEEQRKAASERFRKMWEEKK